MQDPFSEQKQESPIEETPSKGKGLSLAMGACLALLILTNGLQWYYNKSYKKENSQQFATLLEAQAFASTLKDQVENKEQTLTGLESELHIRDQLIQDLELQTQQQERLVREMKSIEARLMAENENLQVERTQMAEMVVAAHFALDDLKNASASEAASLHDRSRELKSTYAVQALALLDIIMQLKNSEQNLQNSLSEMSELMALKEVSEAEKARTVAPSERYVFNETIDSLSREVRRLQSELSGLNQKLNEEKAFSISREDLLSQVSETLQAQRASLGNLEAARQSLEEELTRAKGQYEELVDMSKGTISQGSGEKTPATNQQKTEKTNGSSRIHIVEAGETLTSISLQYFGTTKRWRDIYKANKESLPNRDRIKVGTVLEIP